MYNYYVIPTVMTNLPDLYFYRLAKYQAFKNFSKRIMVATDLFGRGMDIERVNIVFNYDMPENSDTYLHRVNRVFYHTCNYPAYVLSRLLVLDVSAQKDWQSLLCPTKVMQKCLTLYKIVSKSTLHSFRML